MNNLSLVEAILIAFCHVLFPSQVIFFINGCVAQKSKGKCSNYFNELNAWLWHEIKGDRESHTHSIGKEATNKKVQPAAPNRKVSVSLHGYCPGINSPFAGHPYLWDPRPGRSKPTQSGWDMEGCWPWAPGDDKTLDPNRDHVQETQLCLQARLGFYRASVDCQQLYRDRENAATDLGAVPQARRARDQAKACTCVNFGGLLIKC